MIFFFTWRYFYICLFFFSSRRRHTRSLRDWSSDVCSSDLAAVRAGIAFFGKNTMAITRHHGSWVVLGALVTDVEIDPSPPLELDCGACTLCIDACPTGALDEPGTL